MRTRAFLSIFYARMVILGADANEERSCKMLSFMKSQAIALSHAQQADNKSSAGDSQARPIA